MICANCDKPNKTLYAKDNQWLCEKCLDDRDWVHKVKSATLAANEWNGRQAKRQKIENERAFTEMR